MAKCFIFLLLVLVLTGCNNNSSQAEKDYIENLEKKNAALEKELQEIDGNSSDESKEVSKKSKNYFTIGSTEDEVIDVMGDPTTYNTIGPFKTLSYGLSSVKFEDGRVTGYDNEDGNLKVRMK